MQVNVSLVLIGRGKSPPPFPIPTERPVNLDGAISVLEGVTGMLAEVSCRVPDCSPDICSDSSGVLIQQHP